MGNFQRAAGIPWYLVLSACFYRAADSRVIAKIHEQYEYNLKRYAEITVDNLHRYLSKKMSAWLTWFPHKDSPNYEAPKEDSEDKDKEQRVEHQTLLKCLQTTKWLERNSVMANPMMLNALSQMNQNPKHQTRTSNLGDVCNLEYGLPLFRE